MQVPRESLDDFLNIDSELKTAEPPAAISLHLTGEIEVLKPLARTDQLVRFRAATGRMIVRPVPLPPQKGFSWYHRSLAFSGAVAVGALLLGIFAGIYAPPEPVISQDGLVQDRPPEGIRAYRNEAETNGISAATSPPRLRDSTYAGRSAEKRKSGRPRHLRTGLRPKRTLPQPHLVVSEFVPTTLIIYVENGEVKTRIEPQPTAIHRKKT